VKRQEATIWSNQVDLRRSYLLEFHVNLRRCFVTQQFFLAQAQR
jgi:hypothetical protein